MSLHSKQLSVLIGKETDYGVAVSTTKDIGLIQDLSPKPKKTLTEVYASGSRQVQSIETGLFEFEVPFELIMQHGRILEYLTGSVSHSTTSSDTKHTFDTAETIPSFTLEDGYNATTDVTSKYAGCKINEGTLSIEKDGLLNFKGTAFAKTVLDSTSTTAAVISTLKPLHYKHLSLLVGTAGAEASVGKLQNCNLTIANDLERTNTSGNVLTQELIEKGVKLSGDFTILFESNTEYERFLGSTSPQTTPTAFSIVINAHNGVTLGSGRREFYAQLNDCQYSEAGKAARVNDVVAQTFNFTATDYGTNGMYYVDNLASGSF